MNRDWWASPTEAFIYNEFADALREGLRLGVLERDDLMTEDLLVLAKLDAVGEPENRPEAGDDPAPSARSQPTATCPASSPRSAGSIRPY